MELFKYLKPNRVDVLENLKIRYTQPSALNDPFESFPGIIQKNRVWYKKQFMKQAEAEAKGCNFKSSAKLKQFLRSKKHKFNDFYNSFTDESQLFEDAQSIVRLNSMVTGYLSLSATNKNVLMWSHYAQDHEGFVIGFDSTHEYFNYGLIKVVYSDERPFLDPTQSKQDASVFYTKSRDWKYEEEYRKSIAFVEPIALENGNSLLPFPGEPPKADNEALHTVRLFDFPKETISSIIVGWKVNPDTLHRLQNSIKKHHLDHVNIFKAKPHRFKYEVEIHGI